MKDEGRITKRIGIPYPDVFYGTQVESTVVKRSAPRTAPKPAPKK